MPRNSWDDRQVPENHRSKRRLDEEPRRDDREHKRHRGYDDRDKNRRRSRSRSRSPVRDEKPRRKEWQKKSRFDSAFVSKKEASPEWGRPQVKDEPKVKVEKEKPNFATSGKLTEETNTVYGVVIKYSEPPEARKPKRRWRLYPFKGEKSLPVLYIHRQSAYLMGRHRKIADFPLDHPSCSKQHAVLQYRLTSYKRPDGSEGKRIRPYLIDLESANGTYINGAKIEPKRYYELMERDVLKFGYSSREYVLLHENSKDETEDDDVKEEEEAAVVNE